MDWDLNIGFYIKDVPYIWIHKQEWRQCYRVYLVIFSEGDIISEKKFREFQKKILETTEGCEHKEYILRYFSFKTNENPELLREILLKYSSYQIRINGMPSSLKINFDEKNFGLPFSKEFIILEKNREYTLINKINSRFEKLYSKYGEPPSFTIGDSHEEIKKSFNRYGAVFVDYYSEELYTQTLLRDCIEMYQVIFGPLGEKSKGFSSSPDFKIEEFKSLDNKRFIDELAHIRQKYSKIFKFEGEFVIATLCSFWKPEYGFGNCNFRFFYLQFLEKDYKFPIDDISKPIEFSYNPIHRHDIRLIEQVPELWGIMRGMYPSPAEVMMSWDSQKIRFYDTGRSGPEKKPGKPDMTPRHHDIYEYGGKELDRLQAMLLFQHPKAISLGYVIFSNDRKIRKYIKLLVGEKKLFGRVDHPLLNPILDKWWRTINNGFVMWKQETIHYEGIPNFSNNFIKSLDISAKIINHLSYIAIRAVIGVHTPKNLSRKALYQIAFLSEYGLLPEIYKNKKNNKGTPVETNLVNSKGTQYLVPRKLLQIEKDILSRLSNEYTDSYIKKYIDGLPKIVREMYGIY
jgi:hypothetical protein